MLCPTNDAIFRFGKESKKHISDRNLMQIQNKVPAVLSSKILTVGPDYHNHRGGVGAVIEVYSQNFETFNFVSSYKEGSVLYKVAIFFRGLFRLFFKLISDRKIKIIHIHGASYGSFYRKFIVFIIGKYFFGKKIIYHIHGGGFQKFYEENNSISKRLIRLFLRKADVVICVSLSCMDYFSLNLKTKKITTLPNIIDYPNVNKNNIDHAIITFLFLGLITEAKGIFDLINVIAKNKDKYRNRIRLLIGGNGKTEKLIDLINKNDIPDIVEFLGWIGGNNKIAAFNRSDVYILPSYVEGSPISILEAMSYRMAVIATTIGGIPELVKNKENGLLIEPGNLDQIEKALNYFVMNPELIQTFGAVSELISQKHLPDSVLKKLIDIYQSVLSHE
jgi:glycosyltransferase involved in cell wall biosynthesis